MKYGTHQISVIFQTSCGSFYWSHTNNNEQLPFSATLLIRRMSVLKDVWIPPYIAQHIYKVPPYLQAYIA